MTKEIKALLRRLEWSGTYSYCTGWACCPICRGIEPGVGYDRKTNTWPFSEHK